MSIENLSNNSKKNNCPTMQLSSWSIRNDQMLLLDFICNDQVRLKSFVSPQNQKTKEKNLNETHCYKRLCLTISFWCMNCQAWQAILNKLTTTRILEYWINVVKRFHVSSSTTITSLVIRKLLWQDRYFLCCVR